MRTIHAGPRALAVIALGFALLAAAYVMEATARPRTASVAQAAVPSAQQPFMGTGHPNIWMEADYGAAGMWQVRVETIVPLSDSDAAKVKAWLEESRLEARGTAAWKSTNQVLADFLIKRVPAGQASGDAKHMVAAGFGHEWSKGASKTSQY